jgi:hypothetical protein
MTGKIGDHMRPLGVALLAAAIGGLPAAAADLPARKAGLWEVKTATDNRGGGLVVQQCIDQATDQMLQSSTGPIAAASCTRRDVQKSGDTLVIDSTCTVDGKAAKSHAVVTGSFDSAYTMNVTSQGEALQTGLNMTMTAKWLGACAVDQKPGDVIMPGGAKVNIPELQKRAPSPIVGPR